MWGGSVAWVRTHRRSPVQAARACAPGAQPSRVHRVMSCFFFIYIYIYIYYGRLVCVHSPAGSEDGGTCGGTRTEPAVRRRGAWRRRCREAPAHRGHALSCASYHIIFTGAGTFVSPDSCPYSWATRVCTAGRRLVGGPHCPVGTHTGRVRSERGAPARRARAVSAVRRRRGRAAHPEPAARCTAGAWCRHGRGDAMLRRKLG